MIQQGETDVDEMEVVPAVAPGAAGRHPVRVSRLTVGLVVVGGAIWVFSAVAYSVLVLTCFSCGPAVVAAGVDTSTYSPEAINTLAWDAMYANVYVATIGVLAILVGLTAFRRGERWAWFAMAVFALAGLLTAILDELAWGGWYTYLFLGLLPTLGVAISAPSFLRRSDAGG